MSRRLKSYLALAIVAIVTAVATPLAAADAATTPKPPTFSHYVALGDSYTAGPLIPWQQASWCFRSNNNYPSWLATKLGIYYTSGAFTDASCSSATTTDMENGQVAPSPELAFVTEDPQFDSLTLDTDLVTIGIGGNDDHVFGNLVYTCPTFRSSDPTGAPCKEHYTVNGVDTMTKALQQTQKNVQKVIAGVKTRSPGAKILVIGYPRLVPPTGYCPDEIPFADGDYRWVDKVERNLNSALSRAASNKGVTYVDTYGPSLGHDACAGDAAWVNGQWTNLVKAVAYHPLEQGMEAEANIIYNVLAGKTVSGAKNTKPVGERTKAAAKNATPKSDLAKKADKAFDLP